GRPLPLRPDRTQGAQPHRRALPLPRRPDHPPRGHLLLLAMGAPGARPRGPAPGLGAAPAREGPRHGARQPAGVHGQDSDRSRIAAVMSEGLMEPVTLHFEEPEAIKRLFIII